MNWATAEQRLSTPAPRRFAPRHRWDRNFFLLIVALIALGVFAGFGMDMYAHFTEHEAPFPSIIRIHGPVFGCWLVLLIVQVLLIRSRRVDLHRALGIAGAVLAGIMVVLGAVTALTVQSLDFAQTGKSPVFIAVQFTDILAFATLIGAALLWRRDAATHKRLVLLATLYISDAGFVRLLGPELTAAFGAGFWGRGAHLYLSNDVLALGIGAYDLLTRGRLHPAYLAGLGWTLALQLTALTLLFSPWWSPIALHLIGR